MTNHAGLKETGRSLSVTIDITKPIVSYVGDFGRVDQERDYVRSAKPLMVVWEAEDPESGIDSVQWCIGTLKGACDLVPKIDIPMAQRNAIRTDADKLVSPGIWYYSTVFVRNRAGTFPLGADMGAMASMLGASLANVFCSFFVVLPFPDYSKVFI